MKVGVVLALIVCSSLYNIVLANDVDFSVSLNQLSNIEVETASRKSELVSDAPGIVSVYTHEDIRSFGALTLFDVLNRIPGVQSHIAPGIDRVTVRGGEVNSSLVRVLILIDGKPLRVDNGNIASYSVFYAFPVDHIERIEVIRGPGSVLYGTHAVEGVINIITRKSEPGKTKTTVMAGDWNTTLIESSLFSVDEHADLSIGSRMFYSDRPPFTTGYQGIPDSTFNLRKPEFNLSLVGSATLGKLSASFYAANVESGIVDRVPELLPTNGRIDFLSRVTQFSATWEDKLWSDATWALSYTHNFEEFEWEIADARALYFINWMHMLETTLDVDVSDDLRLLGGYATTFYHGDKTTNYNAYELWLHRLFVQSDYALSKELKATVGLELNKSQGSDIELTPRLAFLWSDGAWTAKLLASQAYRVPAATEFTVDNPPYEKGNPNLFPERTSTIDVQLVHSTANSHISVSGFVSRSTDLIRFQPDPSDTSYDVFAENVGESESYGLELESTLWFGDFRVLNSITWYHHTLDDTLEHFTLLPQLTLKSGIEYSFEPLQVSLFLNAHSAPEESYLRSPIAVKSNPKPTALALLDANVQYQLNDLFDLEESGKLWVRAFVTNVLNTKGFGPDVLFYRQNSLPTTYGRTFTIGLMGTL